MKILFVQPRTNYLVQNKLSAFPLTFPQLINDLSLRLDQFDIYDQNKTPKDILEYVSNKKYDYVFITSITSNYPQALKIADQLKEYNTPIIFGGPFPALNAQKILAHNPDIYCVVAGFPDQTLFRLLQRDIGRQKHIKYRRRYSMDKISDIMLDEKFIRLYAGDYVCYELSSGCNYECNYCTLHHLRDSRTIISRSSDDASCDLENLSRHWRKLKLIDDDIFLSKRFLRSLNTNDNFDDVIVETRLDTINKDTVALYSDCGVTSIIYGVESFNEKTIEYFNKKGGGKDKTREAEANDAIDLLLKYNITPKPVFMLTAPLIDPQELNRSVKALSSWSIGAGVQLLLSFYTPHPGLLTPKPEGVFVTKNLEYYDHLHPVFLPKTLSLGGINNVIDKYNEVVSLTRSSLFNPPIDYPYIETDKYEIFFEG